MGALWILVVVYEELMNKVCCRSHLDVKVSASHKLKIKAHEKK